MARTAGQMPRRLSWFDSAALVHAAVPPLRAGDARSEGLAEGEDLTARAVAYTGLAALFGLPILMLASMLLDAPFAAPAAIALGYLATSYALASDHPRSAAAINAAVLVGLVVWAASSLVAGEGVSPAGLAAALLAPFFAAAPAVARLAIAPRMDRASRVALRNTACLDQLAPREAVLVVRRDATLLAATRAAQASLRLAAGALGIDVTRRFGLIDRPKLADAIARCRPGDEPVEITTRSECGGHSDEEAGLTVTVSAIEEGVLSIRLAAAGAGGPAAVIERRSGEGPAHGGGVTAGPGCDIDAAVSFALRRAEPNAEARQAVLTANVEEGIAARCDRQLCRRILFLMIDSALARSGPGDALHLTARALKHVVLLQLVGARGPDDEQSAAGAKTDHDLARLRQLAEEAGGTLVTDSLAGEMRISVRLDRAVGSLADMKAADGGRLR
jgi:hypothetical protein